MDLEGKGFLSAEKLLSSFFLYLCIGTLRMKVKEFSERDF